MTATLPKPIRVSSTPLAPGQVVRGQEGFMKLNMELDFVNRSTNGRKCSCSIVTALQSGGCSLAGHLHIGAGTELRYELG